MSILSINDIGIDPEYGRRWRVLLQEFLEANPNPEGGAWDEEGLPEEHGVVLPDGSLLLQLEFPEPLVGPSLQVPAAHWMLVSDGTSSSN